MRSVAMALAGLLAAGSLALADGPESGLNEGDAVRPTNPRHLSGSLKGTKACPV